MQEFYQNNHSVKWANNSKNESNSLVDESPRDCLDGNDVLLRERICHIVEVRVATGAGGIFFGIADITEGQF